MPRQLIRNPIVWIAGVFAAALAIIFTYACISAFIDPTENARDVPIAVVSEDTGAAFHNIKLNLGSELASSLSSGEVNSKEVRFTVLDSRRALLERMRNDKVFAVIVVPRDFSQKVAALLAGNSSAGDGLRIEILTNPEAGTIASSSGERIATETVQRFEKAAVTRINAGLSLLGVKTTGDLAGAFASTGVVTVKPAVALPVKSALGTGPFFFQLTIVLGGFFSALGSAAVAMVTLFFLLTFDVVGRIVAVLVTILFAVPSSGGVYPAQTLPRFFRFLGDWLPLRRMTDGGRSLTFFNGNGAAGLDKALWVLASYLVAFTLLTLLIVWRRREKEPKTARLPG